MSLFIVFIFLWSLLLAVAHWSRAVVQIIKGAYGEWSLCAGHAVMYSVVCIDAFLRIFSTSHTGLW